MLMCAFMVFLGVLTVAAFAQDTDMKGKGELRVAPKGVSYLTMSGTAAQIGNYTGHSEIELVSVGKAGEEEGEGVAVLLNEKGEQLVGEVTWQRRAGVGQLTFMWRDAVILQDGTVAHSTEHFAKSLPTDRVVKTQDTHVSLVVIAIIAILIG